MLKPIVVLAFVPFVFGVAKSNSFVRYIPGGRIVGGHDADIIDYPYQLSLIFAGFGHFCGASLISSNWAVTAAHCTDGLNFTDISIRAGSSDFSTGGQIVNVSKIIQHQDFDYDLALFDIALLQFSSNVTIPTAKPIMLASRRPAVGRAATISGWGRISEEDESLGSKILQVVQVPIVSQEDCNTVYMNAITDTMLCAGFLGMGGKDACVGDSGGPLVVDGVLSGIISWGIGCAQPKYPGVYTSVSDLAEWVQENLPEQF